MHGLTGTWRLVRLALRRDRLKLPLIILGLTAGVAPSVAATINLYNTPQEQMVYATTTAPSILARAFGGPLNGANLGAIVMNETFLFTAIGVAFISTLTVVRHTRQNEETGRAELIGSGIVARHASLVAALLVAVGTNIVLTVLMSLALIMNDMPVGGSIAFGAALGCIGLVFAAIAAVAAQVSDSARGANGLAALAIGAAFMLRAIGDGFGNLTNHGTVVVSLWPSWLSPLGWGQQLHPFTEQNWGVFGLFGLFFFAMVGLAFFLTVHRDVGMGLWAARKGPARAAANLLSPLGLAWRLQHGMVQGWVIGITVLSVCYGFMGKELENMFSENPQVAEVLKQLGGSGALTDAFLGTIIGFMALAVAAYTVQSLLRLRSEEAAGQLEPLLATSVSRARWMLSHVICAVGGALLLTLIIGVATGVSYAVAADAGWDKVGVLTTAALVQLPASLIIASIVTLVFGLMPRLTIAIGWSLLSVCIVIGQFGPLLKLPHWIMNLSPFTHAPIMPAEKFQLTPMLVMSGLALALFIAAFVAFRRRDAAGA